MNLIKPRKVAWIDGWGRDMVTWLFNMPTAGREEFKDLIDQVEKEINFQCVIFAECDFGLLAIDLNDSDTWTIKNNKIDVYVKMQYNPKVDYGRKVYPFTYVPQHPIEFNSKLCEYQLAYANTPKDLECWTRMIAVSLNRFHIAHQMRKLGINYGGLYCQSLTGYDDHALDPVMPRSRMPFEEYFKWQCRAKCTIDARGYGDFTHRLIECMGIGIPVIRPSLNVTTFDPIIEGVHYLNCGPNGEYLESCLKLMANDEIRTMLIRNGRLWYNRNCTNETAQPLLHRIIFGQPR